MINKNKYNHHNRDSELFDAVFLGDISKVRYLIDIGADVNSIHNASGEPYNEFYEYCNCLFVALKKSYLEIAKILIDAGADVNAPLYLWLDYFNEKPSCYTLDATLYKERPCIEGLKLMLTTGASISHNSNWNPLLTVCSFKNNSDQSYNEILFECAKELITAGCQINYIDSLYNHTPLFMAAVNGHTKIVKLLIDNGAMPDLASSLLLSKHECVEYFLAHNSEKVNNIAYVLCRASQGNNIALIKRILKHGISLNVTSLDTTYQKFCPLSSTYNYDTMKFLLENGADPNYVMDGDYHPSILCSKLHSDSLDELILFLEYGANTNHKYNDCYNHTALHIALRSSLPYQKSKLLLKYGADIFACDSEGLSVMHHIFYYQYNTDTNDTLYASLEEILFTINLLLENGAIPDARDNNGNTPLHKAAANGYGEFILQKLIEEGNNSTTKNNFEETALDLAIKTDNKEAISFLTSRGVEHNIFASFINDTFYNLLEKIKHIKEFNIIDSEYNSLLHYATQRGLFSLVRELISKDVNINCFNISHQTPLDLAIKNNHVPVIEYLKMHNAKTYKELNIDTCNYWLPKKSNIVEICYTFIGFSSEFWYQDITFKCSSPLIDSQKEIFKAIFTFISSIFKINFKESNDFSKIDLFIGQSDSASENDSIIQFHSSNGITLTNANLQISSCHFDDKNIKEYPNYCYSRFLRDISIVLGLVRTDKSASNKLDKSILHPIIKPNKDFSEPKLYSRTDYLRLSSRYSIRKGLLSSILVRFQNEDLDNTDKFVQILRDRDIKKLKKAIKHDTNLKDVTGTSLMHLAIISDFTEGAKLLYQKGAELDLASALVLNLPDKVNEIVNKQLPQQNYELLNHLMLIAVLKENLTLAKALINYGVQINDEIFILSIEIGNFDIIKLLISAGANLNAINKDSENTQYIASKLDPTGKLLELLEQSQKNSQKYEEPKIIDFKTRRILQI